MLLMLSGCGAGLPDSGPDQRRTPSPATTGFTLSEWATYQITPALSHDITPPRHAALSRATSPLARRAASSCRSASALAAPQRRYHSDVVANAGLI